MFSEILFQDPTLQVRTPAQARGWASTHLTSLPPEFFARDARGIKLQGHCPFTIRPSRGGVAMDGFGAEATGRLLTIAAALRADFLRACPKGQFHLRSGVAHLAVSSRLRRYEVFDFVLQNSSSQKMIFSRWKQHPDVQAITTIAEDLFRRRLDERCRILDIDPPDEAIFGDFAAIPVRPVYAGGVPKFAVNLSFRSNVIFEGPWYLGRLASKSCGRVRLHRKIEITEEA